MDCKTARLLAELRGNRSALRQGDRQEELPGEDALHLEQHLQACSECERLRRIEEKLDAPIARAMRSVSIPASLKAKVLDRLATQRGAVYRRRFFVAAAAAACVVISVGLLTWDRRGPAKLDLNELIADAERHLEDPRGTVHSWMKEQGVAFEPPVAFDANLLAFHGMTTLQGKQVPTLIYRRVDPRTGAAVHAYVCVLQGKDWQLNELPEEFSGSSPLGFHVEIHHRGQPGRAGLCHLVPGAIRSTRSARKLSST